MAAESKTPTPEREKRVMSGWLMLPVAIALYVAGPVLITLAFIHSTTSADGGVNPVWAYLVGGILALGVAILLSPGFFTLQPNEARMLVLFGDYKGTCKQGGSAGATPSTPTARPGRQGASRSGRRTRGRAAARPHRTSRRS